MRATDLAPYAQRMRALGRELMALARATPAIEAAQLSNSLPIEAGERPHWILELWVDGDFETASTVRIAVNRQRRGFERDLELREGSAVVITHWDTGLDEQS